MADSIETLIEDAINLFVQCEETYFQANGHYYNGPGYGLVEYGWVKPAPWITVMVDAISDDDFSVVATHVDSIYDRYVWQKSADPQFTRIPKE